MAGELGLGAPGLEASGLLHCGHCDPAPRPGSFGTPGAVIGAARFAGLVQRA